MSWTQEDYERNMQILEETAYKGGFPSLPQEILDYKKLSRIEELTLEAGGRKFTVYKCTANNRSEKAPVVLSIHGGGWFTPHLENDVCYSSYLADKVGGIVYSPDYTTSDKAGYELMSAQCFETLKYAFEHAAEDGGDVENISVGGYSAGGHLAAGIVLRAKKEGIIPVKSQFLCYAPLYFRDTPEELIDNSNQRMSIRMAAFEELLFRHSEELYEDPEANLLSAKNEDLALFPDSLVIAAELCTFRKENKDFAQKLEDAGVKTSFTCYPGERHGFIPHFVGNWKGAVEEITAFVQ
ncbi:MAG: alpha/beta hydrolase fold domain-containing protein [Solobacterium sp.]|nr:alpha/beta hydrolase fold domain-containing protein [Solobacterium sp.]